jgi:citrate lyase subunit beta / citryl-CoA lyase
MKACVGWGRLLRSALYMPASNLKAIAKARTLPVDAIILDLEDAVAPGAKEIAREQACAAVSEGGFGAREVIVRINGRDTEWHNADLAAAVACAPDGILVPKVDTAEDVLSLNRALAGAPPIELWAMIETCASLANLFEIAALARSTRLSTFVMGTNDLASEMRARLAPDRAPLHFALSLAISAGRASDVTLLDGVHNDIDDLESFEQECRQGVTFGFDGKTLIHPKQIELCNRIYLPSAREIAWSRLVIAEFELPENVALGAIQVQGRMVERLHLEHARRIVALTEAVGSVA